jgi:hypothetical protein
VHQRHGARPESAEPPDDPSPDRSAIRGACRGSLKRICLLPGYHVTMAKVCVELPLPQPVETATRAVEVLRAWECDGVLHLTMSEGLPANLAGCALFLADVVRIIARAEHLHPKQQSVEAIQQLKHYLFAYLRPEPQETPPDAPLLITYNDFLRLYHAETDRAAAVLAGSYVETYLGDCLRYYLVDHAATQSMFKNSGPLETFAARANIAFALGLMTEETRSNLRYIMKIRNHFAHHPAETSFAAAPVRDYCANLSTAKQLPDRAPRELYLFAVSDAVLQLNNAMLSVVRLKSLGELGGG